MKKLKVIKKEMELENAYDNGYVAGAAKQLEIERKKEKQITEARVAAITNIIQSSAQMQEAIARLIIGLP